MTFILCGSLVEWLALFANRKSDIGAHSRPHVRHLQWWQFLRFLFVHFFLIKKRKKEKGKIRNNIVKEQRWDKSQFNVINRMKHSKCWHLEEEAFSKNNKRVQYVVSFFLFSSSLDECVCLMLWQQQPIDRKLLCKATPCWKNSWCFIKVMQRRKREAMERRRRRRRKKKPLAGDPEANVALTWKKKGKERKTKISFTKLSSVGSSRSTT